MTWGGKKGQTKRFFSYDNWRKEVQKKIAYKEWQGFFFTISRAVLSLNDFASIGLLTIRV